MTGRIPTAFFPGWSTVFFLRSLFIKSGEYQLLLQPGKLIFRVATNTGGGAWDKEVEISHSFVTTNWYHAVLWIEPGVEIGLSPNAGTPQTESLATGQAARVVGGEVYISLPVYSSYSYPSSFAMMEESEDSGALEPYRGIVDEIAVFDAALSGAQRTSLWNYGTGIFWHAEHEAWGSCDWYPSWWSSVSYPVSSFPSSLPQSSISSSSRSSDYSSYYYSSWVGLVSERHSSKAAPAPVTEGLLSLAVSELPEMTLCQYVWGARPGHRDELILRDRDCPHAAREDLRNGFADTMPLNTAEQSDFGGELNERLYCLMDYYDPTSTVDTNGEVVERYGFSAFGVRTVMGPDWSPREESLFDWSFGFHGQFLDSETGYYNYGYRYYIPWLGRWPNRDPIGERGGVNLYGFAGNNGIKRLDRLGLYPDHRDVGCCEDDRGKKTTYDPALECCVDGKLFSTSAKENVRICFRPSTLFGEKLGQNLSDSHAYGHAYAVTSTTSTGLGPGDGPSKSEMVDHSTANPSADICIDVEVDKCCFEKKIAEGTQFPGYFPATNDCNTAMREAVEACGGGKSWSDIVTEKQKLNIPYQNNMNAPIEFPYGCP